MGSIFRLLFILILCGVSCNTSYILISDIDKVEPDDSFDWSIVDRISDSYECYNEDRIVNVMFRFINSSDTTLDLNIDQARSISNILVSDVNKRLRNNAKMNLPLGNETPALDTHIQLKLKSENVFIHYDRNPYFRKKGKKSNQYNREILKRYARESINHLNIFIMPFDPSEIKSGIQKFDKSGIALGNNIKLGGLVDSGHPAWEYGGVLMHEIGHVLGLRHSWDNNDGCDDTPRHSNCWSNTGVAPCDQLESNNFMDYNPHQSAITPCQIIKMQSKLATMGTQQHRIAEENWCAKQEGDLIITDKQKWSNSLFISRDITIAKEGVLVVSNWLSMAEGSQITVEKGGQLLIDGGRIYNYCKSPWNGIFVHPKGLMKSRNHSLVENVKLESEKFN